MILIVIRKSCLKKFQAFGWNLERSRSGVKKVFDKKPLLFTYAKCYLNVDDFVFTKRSFPQDPNYGNIQHLVQKLIPVWPFWRFLFTRGVWPNRQRENRVAACWE